MASGALSVIEIGTLMMPMWHVVVLDYQEQQMHQQEYVRLYSDYLNNDHVLLSYSLSMAVAKGKYG